LQGFFTHFNQHIDIQQKEDAPYAMFNTTQAEKNN